MYEFPPNNTNLPSILSDSKFFLQRSCPSVHCPWACVFRGLGQWCRGQRCTRWPHLLQRQLSRLLQDRLQEGRRQSGLASGQPSHLSRPRVEPPTNKKTFSMFGLPRKNKRKEKRKNFEDLMPEVSFRIVVFGVFRSLSAFLFRLFFKPKNKNFSCLIVFPVFRPFDVVLLYHCFYSSNKMSKRDVFTQHLLSTSCDVVIVLHSCLKKQYAPRLLADIPCSTFSLLKR